MNLIRLDRANDPALHMQNIRMLACVPWRMTKESFFALFPGVFADTDNFRVIQRNARTSPGVAIWNNDEMVIIMGGMVDNQNVLACVTAWAGGHPYVRDRSMPQVFGYAWESVVSDVPEINTVPYSKIRMIGYSFGGGVVTAGVALIAGLHRRIDKEVFTYGAPRTSYTSGFSNWTDIPLIRVWHTVDPVVNMPPHTAEIPLLTAFMGVHPAENMNRVWHPVGGLRLNSDGTFDSMSEARVEIPYQWALLAAWMGGSDVFGSPNHAISNYVDALTLAVARTPPQGPLVVPRQGDRVPVPSVPVLRSLVGQALETAGRNTQEDLRRAIADVMSRVTLVPGQKFRPRSIFRNRVVTYAGDTVLATPRKRFRRQVIRELNKLVPKS